MMKARRSSAQSGDSPSVTRERFGEAPRIRKDALTTSDALGLRFTSALARTRLQREFSLDAACGDATGERRGAVIWTSALSATSALSWRRSVAEARSQARGEAKLTGSARAKTFGRVVRAPMQKFLLPCLPCFATLTPNQAMQLTPTRCTIHFQ